MSRLARGLARWLVVPTAIAASCGCAAGPDPPAGSAAPSRLLLIGIDGLEWSVVLPLIRDGRMPHLEALMRRGSFGRLETLTPTRSPAIWTSVATGRLPEEHGILDFVRDGPDGRKRLYTSAERRTKALWNIFSDAGKRVTVVSWWNTFPAEEVSGVLVAQANTLEQMARQGVRKPGGMLRGVDGQVYPSSRQDEMLEITAEVDRELPAVLSGIFGEIGRDPGRADRVNLDASAWSVRADESTRRIALRLAAEEPAPALFAVYFGATDVVAHRFWRYHEPQAFEHPPTADAVAEFGNVINDAYANADAVVGELVAALPDDTTVIVISDHGMRAHGTSVRFDVTENGQLELQSGAHEDGPAGLIVAAGPGIRTFHPAISIRETSERELTDIGTVVDIAPTVLNLALLPLGRDMHGNVLESILDEEFLRSHPATYVETHDDPEWIASRGTDAGKVPGTEERLEQLRSLGYIEGRPAEKEKP